MSSEFTPLSQWRAVRLASDTFYNTAMRANYPSTMDAADLSHTTAKKQGPASGRANPSKDQTQASAKQLTSAPKSIAARTIFQTLKVTVGKLAQNNGLGLASHQSDCDSHLINPEIKRGSLAASKTYTEAENA